MQFEEAQPKAEEETLTEVAEPAQAEGIDEVSETTPEETPETEAQISDDAEELHTADDGTDVQEIEEDTPPETQETMEPADAEAAHSDEPEQQADEDITLVSDSVDDEDTTREITEEPEIAEAVEPASNDAEDTRVAPNEPEGEEEEEESRLAALVAKVKAKQRAAATTQNERVKFTTAAAPTEEAGEDFLDFFNTETPNDRSIMKEDQPAHPDMVGEAEPKTAPDDFSDFLNGSAKPTNNDGLPGATDLKPEG